MTVTDQKAALEGIRAQFKQDTRLRGTDWEEHPGGDVVLRLTFSHALDEKTLGGIIDQLRIAGWWAAMTFDDRPAIAVSCSGALDG